MGRSALVVKAAELKSLISEMEAKQTYASLGELCDAVAQTDWAKNIRNEKHAIRGLSPQMVGVKIREFGIVPQTKPGARGKSLGGSTKIPRSDKVKKLKLDKYAKALRDEVKDVPERYQKYAEAALQGNAIAAIKLTCGQCMGYSGAEKSCDGALGGVPCGNYVMNRLAFTKRLGLKPNPKSGFYELVKAMEQAELQ